jgi:hypothetical protein
MKKTIYIILSTILGTTLSFLFHAILEYSYIASTDVETIRWYGSFGGGFSGGGFGGGGGGSW